MNKLLKYFIGLIAILAVIYFSFDIENLQEYQAKTKSTTFNAADYAHHFWTEDLPKSIEQAPTATTLLQLLNENPTLAFTEYGKKLGISKTYYFMIKGSGTIHSMEDEYISVVVSNNDTIHLATAFIFGNAVRDGSGMVDINDFVNMTDFNNVSIAINKLAKEQVISRLIRSAKKRKHISFAGATELKEDEMIPETLNLIPVKAIVSDGETK